MFSGKHKAILLTATVAIALFTATPAIRYYFVVPNKTSFTEFWLLDSNHKAENYPYNITYGISNSVFFGIANHLGNYGYYMVEVKLRNYTEPGPDTPAGTPSNLSSLYSSSVFVPNEESREIPLTFSFKYDLSYETYKGSINSVTINNVNINVGPLPVFRNDTLGEWDCNLFFELWIYNGNLNTFQYHGRSLGLHLSLTV